MPLNFGSNRPKLKGIAVDRKLLFAYAKFACMDSCTFCINDLIEINTSCVVVQFNLSFARSDGSCAHYFATQIHYPYLFCMFVIK